MQMLMQQNQDKPAKPKLVSYLKSQAHPGRMRPVVYDGQFFCSGRDLAQSLGMNSTSTAKAFLRDGVLAGKPVRYATDAEINAWLRDNEGYELMKGKPVVRKGQKCKSKKRGVTVKAKKKRVPRTKPREMRFKTGGNPELLVGRCWTSPVVTSDGEVHESVSSAARRLEMSTSTLLSQIKRGNNDNARFATADEAMSQWPDLVPVVSTSTPAQEEMRSQQTPMHECDEAFLGCAWPNGRVTITLAHGPAAWSMTRASIADVPSEILSSLAWVNS